jgi:hypothetical protein
MLLGRSASTRNRAVLDRKKLRPVEFAARISSAGVIHAKKLRALAATGSDKNLAIVERIDKFGQAVIASR